MDRLALWQRIAPPMSAGYGSYRYSTTFLVDSIIFQKNDTWFKPSHEKMVRQSAPAIMARNIALPEVSFEDLAPYVMASKFPNGAIAIATEGRVTQGNSWKEPKADITLKEVEVNKPIGVFGRYNSLTMVFSKRLPGSIKVYGQDLLADQPIDISDKVAINENRIIIDGELIEKIGKMAGDPGDISVPGMVIKAIAN